MQKTVKIKVPATSANLGPGFDTLGLALSLHNEFEFRETDSGYRVAINGEGADVLPQDETNLAVQAAMIVFNKVNYPIKGLEVDCLCHIPIDSGFGSSATAIVAGMFAANEIAGQPLTKQEILNLAVETEGHPDNISPAIYGGLTISVHNRDSLYVEQVDLFDWELVMLLPDYHLATVEARSVLPRIIPLTDAVYNLGNAAMLVNVLRNGERSKLKTAMKDRLHQPFRLPLMLGSEAALEAMYSAGASGVALSGAGPSLIAFADAKLHDDIIFAGQTAFMAVGTKSRVWTVGIDRIGVQIIS